MSKAIWLDCAYYGICKLKAENEILKIAVKNIPRLMYCPNCEKEVSSTISKHIDCNDCRGTGIGYPPPETKCGICKGRGYLIVEPYYVCDECDEYISKV